MATVVIIGGGCGLRIKHIIVINLIRVSYCCIAITFTLTFLLNSCTQAARWSASAIKMGVVCMGVCVSRCLKERVGLGYKQMDLCY